METLYKYGWNTYINNSSMYPQVSEHNLGRIMSLKGTTYHLITENDELQAELSGKMLFGLETEDQPKVGDWVEYIPFDSHGLITGLLPRFNRLYRKSAGKETNKQVLAANIDYAVVIQGLDHEFNLNRLERYLVQIATCGIQSRIVLNKSDLVEDEDLYRKQINRLQRNIPVFFCSTLKGNGINTLKREIFKPGNTSALIGSSGVGKSSLINVLRSDTIQKTGKLSNSTGKGKHTTTSSDMLLLDNDSILIDTPGMREFGLGNETESDFESRFPLIGNYAKTCRYADCRHIDEKGCGVLQALENGDLDPLIYENYVKLIKEQKRFEQNRHEKKKAGKRFGKMVREAKEYRRRFKY